MAGSATAGQGGEVQGTHSESYKGFQCIEKEPFMPATGVTPYNGGIRRVLPFW